MFGERRQNGMNIEMSLYVKRSYMHERRTHGKREGRGEFRQNMETKWQKE